MTRETAENDMTFPGLIGMIDPPPPEAKAASETYRAAGGRAVVLEFAKWLGRRGAFGSLECP